ncbi:hypothetical protein X743_14420 [Mesorhizobium sp. LNHC252B00]|uniref:heme exporter protein CcmD n=1 Tax=Mesorhizobium sp. LNHC252B00 TaxID=1287252 RepID=UPI0003CF212B|nr:heme exporter protein CcmD [Mesorhizobium sp. LNHC252B00]ESY72771.1 hypothetical protein X743_14420 [Mesorhizobium sp. LNHC252B00]
MDRLLQALQKFTENLPATKDLLDLQAQQDMVYWTRMTTWAAFASAALSVAGLLGLFWSLSQTRRAIRDSRELGEHQTQAYIHASKAEFGKEQLIISCKNTGQTPATHFGVRGSLTKCVRGSIEKSIDVDSLISQPWKLWTAIGAGEELTVILNAKNELLIREFVSGSFLENEVLLVTGQVLYCTVFNHDHMSDFAFYVEQRATNRFRRPTANLRAYYRAPVKSPVKKLLSTCKRTNPGTPSNG